MWRRRPHRGRKLNDDDRRVHFDDIGFHNEFIDNIVDHVDVIDDDDHGGTPPNDCGDRYHARVPGL